MATTTNFGWETPDDTDLVKDGAAAIRTLGGAIDTSLVDLKGGTTGQVLSKASNTDMDFSWVTSDDANAIQNTIVDAKGDIITATAADTPARLAVGANGYTLVADSSTSTGLAYSPTFFAGKNKIINGDYNINQRNFSSTTTSGTYGFDRFLFYTSGGTTTYSAQTFTPGTAPVSGYESINFARLATTGQSAASDLAIHSQKIEDARTFAGQTVTVSFWAKAATGTPSVAATFWRDYGTGGTPSSAEYAVSAGQKVAITTSWARYLFTFAINSVAGKTFGTNKNSTLELYLWTSAGSNHNTQSASLGIQNATIDFWGIQVEAGSVATSFQTATGTLQGELAACQRYYRKSYDTETAPGTATTNGAVTFYSPNTSSYPWFPTANFGINMRAVPTVTTYNPSTGSTTNPVRNITSSTNHPLFISQTGVNAISAYVDNSSITSGNVISYHYVASAEL